jgi:hypothetical protein
MLIVGNIENEREILRRLRDLSDGALRDKLYGAVERGAAKVAVEAMLRSPKRTGALAVSIVTRGSKKTLSARVYADYPDTGRTRRSTTGKQAAGSREYYAMAMEYGTKRVRARPFLVPALEAKSAEILEDTNRAMEEALNDSGGHI